MKPKEVQVERHYSVKFLAELWGLSESTVLRMFQDEPGVFRIAKESNNGKRTRCELRIPQSVAQRIYEERTR
jgi:AraC-like DNA-binding protein